ncbi:hypothetical protein PLEOSDRAFT_1104972 [Pleurotus ostreatus PC15]|uniref:NACHT domain-containing protein n=1 Tax=Pleurotus ostreatus (strain PC15) TaxID=1137138 RepID=A0A067NK44_PLEO1|nr:hypothetical protein PLEOSDRAFT_1104972 [Pleurotus ostreatus PC15]
MGKPTVDDLLEASVTILSAGGKAVSAAGVPGVGQACELLLAFIHAIQNMKGNDAKRLEISNEIEALARIVADIAEKASKNRNIYSRALEDRMMQLNSELVQYEQVASRLATMRAPERLLRNEAISGALAGLANGVKMSCERTNTLALSQIELNQAHQGQVLDNIHNGFLKSSKAEIDPSTSLPFANAAFDSINVDNKSEVLPGTRVAIMEQVDRWATSTCQERVFWLRGAAGTGKSTIAKSVAAKFSKAKQLGASFFFVQDVQDLGDTRLLITTIACHLARLDGPVGAAIKAAARQQPPGLKGVWWQVNDLLREPLKDLKPQPEPIVIVIDALDEASDRDSVVTSLRLLTTQLITLPVNIKLFVTSRPDPRIETVLSGASLLVLHDIEKTILDHDIKLYIEYAFREIQDSKQAFQYTSEDIQSLVEHSGGLFIYVSTAIKLLKDSIDPSKALQGLFTRKSDRMLDELYLQVLERAFGAHDVNSDISGNRDAWNERLRILGIIVLSQDRHPCSTLAGLLDKRTAAIRDALSHLGAVILVPQDDDLPVRILHASFTDFIVDATRCTNRQFAINTTELHSFLAEECIHHMNRLLVENPCNISDPYALNSDVPDLDERINQFLPRHLQYASRSWAYHLSLSTYSTSLKEQLRVFCKIHLLEWLEVMSLFGRVDLANAHLDTAFKWIKANEALPSTTKTRLFLRMESLFGPTTEETSDEVAMLLYDAYRFTLHFADTIVASARHIYVSALPFVPSCLLYETYQTRLSSAAVKLHHSRDRVWPPYLRFLTGHSGRVLALAMSKDGVHVASSSEDNTLRVWDSSIGTLLAQYETDESPCSIAFSANGSRIIACTYKHVHVWNWPSGTSLQWPIDSPTSDGWGEIPIVAFNTGTRFVVCPNHDIQWWDSEIGLRLKTTTRHSDELISVALSPDDSKIVTASMDFTMHLSESYTGKLLKLFGVDQKVAVSFSPNGHQLFSASRSAVCIWDVQTGAMLRRRIYHPQHDPLLYAIIWRTPAPISFTPDRTRVAIILGYDRVLVFDTSSGARTFNSYFAGGRFGAALMNTVVFSVDGTRVFVGFSDGTIRILSVDYKPDTATSKHKYHCDIQGVAFSPDCTRICTRLRYGRHLYVWGLSTARLLVKLKGHTGRVTSMDFSPDSTQIVSISEDKTIRIWDSDKGHQVKKLDMSRSAAPFCSSITSFGNDLRRLDITFSEDGFLVCLYHSFLRFHWDTRSGKVKVISWSEQALDQAELAESGVLLYHDRYQTSRGRDLKEESSWIVPVSDPSRKLLCIPASLRNFYTYGPFVVLTGQGEFQVAMLDFSHII